MSLLNLNQSSMRVLQILNSSSSFRPLRKFAHIVVSSFAHVPVGSFTTSKTSRIKNSLRSDYHSFITSSIADSYWEVI